MLLLNRLKGDGKWEGDVDGDVDDLGGGWSWEEEVLVVEKVVARGEGWLLGPRPLMYSSKGDVGRQAGDK